MRSRQNENRAILHAAEGNLRRAEPILDGWHDVSNAAFLHPQLC